MSDLIERQAAINEALSFLVEYCGAAFDEDMQNKLYQRLILLPSAQPESTRTFVELVVRYPDPELIVRI